MSNDSDHGIPSPSGGLSMLDRATHLPSVLLLLAFALALDISMSYGIGSSILSMSWNLIRQQITIGHALVFFVAFGIYMAVVVVFMRYAADFVVTTAISPLWQKLFPEGDSQRPPYAHAVRLWKLREAAHMEQNKFYFDRYFEQRNSLDEFQGLVWRLASHAFACLILVAIDSLILPSYGYSSVLQELGVYAPGTWKVVASILVPGLVVLWLFPLFRDWSRDEWAYCPLLSRQLEDERAKALEEGRLPVYLDHGRP